MLLTGFVYTPDGGHETFKLSRFRAHGPVPIRGLPGEKQVPFRMWYGNLGELRSLFSNIHLIVCTATVCTTTKRKIFDVLSLAPEETLSIEMSPERKNLIYVNQYVDNNIPLSETFGKIIAEVKNGKEKARRTLIYCQIRKQCAILWRVFKLQLEEDIYLNRCPMPNGHAQLYM